MKALKFVAVLFILGLAFTPLVLAEGGADEGFMYRPDGEKCVMADMQVRNYAYYGVKWNNLPPGLRKDLALCKKNKDYKVQSGSSYCNQPNMLFLTSRRDVGC